jgi:hypothetical protein
MWWTYLLGPFLSLLPRRWRKALPFHDAVPWHFASIVSGLGESAIALAALLYWYSYSVTTWVSRLLDNALSKSAPIGITDHEVGFAALLIWTTHPLTWFIACFAVEGMARLCAAFTDTVLGAFPLYLLDKIYSRIRGLEEPQPPGTPRFAQSHASSYVSTLREKIAASRLQKVPDELRITKDESEELMEIRACRAKQEWDPPRVVRYEDCYYRLEECARGSAPRPYIYRLRRLAAGVPGRTVLSYSPDEAPVVTSR